MCPIDFPRAITPSFKMGFLFIMNEFKQKDIENTC